ncbi:N-acetylmuramic acid 6-phosphate etherase [Granulicatella balaenopterae]|uniref:N-acetylmuramic acid 6-phosphate etherase n=1 Tax=Granulicatella balaenopterae TaxID=137733 RepID=UPI001C432313
MNLKNMATEKRNVKTMELDCMSSFEIVSIMNSEDQSVPIAIHPHLKSIAQIADWVAKAIMAGGHLYYIGAGTSGRLGVLDSVECPPTFGVNSNTVVGLIAGGDGAFVKAKEGAEDSKILGRNDLIEVNLTNKDVVIGIAASGRTPYVIGALEYANEVGCKTATISCNKDSEIGKVAKLAVDVVVGPEVLTGSTRLKAGTAQKMILNMISTTAMVQCGKVYQNLMVDVQQTNQKLCVRARQIVQEATGVDKQMADQVLSQAQGSCKSAIIMILTGCSYEKALQLLEDANGQVRTAIEKEMKL